MDHGGWKKMIRRKAVSLMTALVMIFLTLPAAVLGEGSGWRILDSQQNDTSLDVWFATDGTISPGQVIYQYGGIPLTEVQLSTAEPVGYIFIVDNTQYFAQAAIKDPKVLVEGAVRKMSNYDYVAFISVRQEDLGQATAFSEKGNWESAYNALFAGSASLSTTKENTWEAISKGVTFAQEMYQKKQVRELVMILITDGSAKGVTKSADSCLTEIERLPFALPFYCLHLAPTKDEGFVEFTSKLAMGVNKTVTKQNASTVGGECVTPFSNLIYRSRLRLGPEIYDAQGQTLTINLAGSQKGASQDTILLNMSLIPSPTPEPTATPTMAPTLEPNPQFVGDGTGSKYDIVAVQEILIKYGFLKTDAPSGDWDAETENAVIQYYNQNGITKDRMPVNGGMTRELYNELVQNAETGAITTLTPVPTETPPPTPTPVPTVDPEYGLYIGYDTQDGGLVRALNRALTAKYYLSGQDSATYTDATQQAVDEFYKDHPELKKPTAGEGITKNAFAVLNSDQTPPKTTPTPSPEPTVEANPIFITYNMEDSGLVAELNHALADRFFVEEPDRIVWDRYNDETDKAVRAFYDYYENLGISPDEIPRPVGRSGITEKAYEFLLSSTPIPTATPIPDLKFVYSEDSIRSGDALRINSRLKELGYLEEDANDVETFRKAVHEFAERNQMVFPEAYLSNSLYDAINSDQARPAVDPPGTLVPGTDQEKEQVVKFQEALEKLKYFRDIQEKYKTGFFDEPTQKAYRRFCEVAGIEWDGKELSWEDQEKVLKSTTENPALNMFENTKKFVTGHYELFGREIPMWVLLAVGLLILIGVIVVVILLVKGQKKPSSGSSSQVPFQPVAPSVNVSMDAPTDEVAESVSTGLDAPTVDPEGCVLSLMITDPNGMSRDVTYNVQDGEQLVIGRGSSADIVTDTEDLSVSRSHGIFRYNARSVSYEDTSSHYTVVDGERIHLESRPLNQGSQLQIGKSFIKVQWS